MITRIEREGAHAYSVYEIIGRGIGFTAAVRSGETVQFIVAHDETRTVVHRSECYFTDSLNARRRGSLRATATKSAIAYDAWLAANGSRWEDGELDKRCVEAVPKLKAEADAAVRRTFLDQAFMIVQRIANPACDLDTSQCMAQDMLAAYGKAFAIELHERALRHRAKLLDARTMREHS